MSEKATAVMVSASPVGVDLVITVPRHSVRALLVTALSAPPHPRLEVNNRAPR